MQTCRSSFQSSANRAIAETPANRTAAPLMPKCLSSSGVAHGASKASSGDRLPNFSQGDHKRTPGRPRVRNQGR